MSWPCQLCLDSVCDDPECAGGRQCQAEFCMPELSVRDCRHVSFDGERCALCGEKLES